MITFTFNGIDSSSMGVHVKVQPQILIPQMRVHLFNIDGYEGTQTARMGRDVLQETFEIIVEGKQNLEKVRAWLMGQGRFTRSDIPNRYRTVAFVNQMDYNYIHYSDSGLYEATLTMTILDPYWYSTNGSNIYTFTNNEVNIENIGTSYSQPVIKITRLGSESSVTISSPYLVITYDFPYGENEVIINTEDKTAKYNNSPRDRFLQINPNLPRLEVGVTRMVLVFGNVSLEITHKDAWL